MKITCEFDSKEEHDKYCDDVAGVKSLRLDIQTLREKIQTLQIENSKAVISEKVLSESYTTENVIKASEMLYDKILGFRMKNDKDIVYQNLYSYGSRKIRDEFPGLNKEVSMALFKSAYKYLVDSNKVFKSVKSQVVHVKEKVIGSTAEKK